jgi:hypothetical protein
MKNEKVAAMYRSTIAICVIATIGSIVCSAFFMPTILGVGMIAVTQAAVYGSIARFAQLCRTHSTASSIVLMVAVAALIASVVLMRLLQPPHHYGTFTYVCLLLFSQIVLAIGGCYVGYALVESAQLSRYTPPSNIGKLIVVLGLAVAGLAIGVLVALV